VPAVPSPSSPDPQRPLFRVRVARRGDADALAALLVELGYPNATDQATVHWVISHPEIEVLVAGDPQDKPVGMITLSHRPQLRARGRIATVEELVVAEAWRGKGVGRELVRHAIERARSLSVKQLELVSHRGRAQYARGFYLKCGFTEADAAVVRMELAPKGSR
jgi:GNAT superfamily N-acetyltransferase